MNAFIEQMSHRVTAAQASLTSALAEGDDYLVVIQQGELDSLARIAADHDLVIPGL